MTEKEMLLQLIQDTENEKIIKYLYHFTNDFIIRHSDAQKDEPFAEQNHVVPA